MSLDPHATPTQRQTHLARHGSLAYFDEDTPDDIVDSYRDALQTAIDRGDLSEVVGKDSQPYPRDRVVNGRLERIYTNAVTAQDALFDALDYVGSVNVCTELVPFLVAASKGENVQERAQQMVKKLVDKWAEGRV